MPSPTTMFVGAQPCTSASASRRSLDVGSPYIQQSAAAARIASTATGLGPSVFSFAPSRTRKGRPRARSCSSGATNGTIDASFWTVCVYRGPEMIDRAPGRPATDRRVDGPNARHILQRLEPRPREGSVEEKKTRHRAGKPQRKVKFPKFRLGQPRAVTMGDTDAPDARTPLLAARSPKRRLAAAVAGLTVMLFGVAVVAGGPGPRGRAGTLALATAPSAVAAEERRVYELLIEEGFAYNVLCTSAGAYALCGLATCSPAGERSKSVAACACRAEPGGESAFEIGGSNVHLAGSAAYRRAVLLAADGALSDEAAAGFCDALTDGTVCAESGFACDSISFHAGALTILRRRAAAASAMAASAMEHIATPTCMGAPCYERDDDDCAATCLCPTGSEYVLDAEIEALDVQVVSQTTCLTHVDDFAVVRSPGQLAGLVSDLSAYGRDPPAVADQCGACSVSDA